MRQVLLIDKIIPVVGEKMVQKVGDELMGKRRHTEREDAESLTTVGHT